MKCLFRACIIKTCLTSSCNTSTQATTWSAGFPRQALPRGNGNWLNDHLISRCSNSYWTKCTYCRHSLQPHVKIHIYSKLALAFEARQCPDWLRTFSRLSTLFDWNQLMSVQQKDTIHSFYSPLLQFPFAAGGLHHSWLNGLDCDSLGGSSYFGAQPSVIALFFTLLLFYFTTTKLLLFHSENRTEYLNLVSDSKQAGKSFSLVLNYSMHVFENNRKRRENIFVTKNNQYHI